MKHSVLKFLRNLAVSDIHLYKLVRTRIALLDFMLPHDDAFFGLAKFGGGAGVFLDVGANDGVSARSYRKLIKDRPILSIEANPLHSEALERTRSVVSDFNFMLMGAAAKRARFVLYTPVFKSVPLTNYASTNPEFARANLSTHMRIREIGNRVSFIETEIATATIDSLGVSPEIVKIDVEGFEAQVLEGMCETIERTLPVFMIEYNPASFEEVSSLLSKYGYQSYAYVRETDSFTGFDYEAPALNAFFLTDDAISRVS